MEDKKSRALVIGELKAEVPVIQGGMGVGISLSGLAGAVAAQGGIGRSAIVRRILMSIRLRQICAQSSRRLKKHGKLLTAVLSALILWWPQESMNAM